MSQEVADSQSIHEGVTELRPIAAELSEYVDLAFKTLEPMKAHLFQLRKCGIRMEVPEPVRQQLMAQCGDEAREMLAMLDGRVWL